MTIEKPAEVLIFSEDPLGSDALKFAMESKGLVVSMYDDLKSALKHIVVRPPHLVIIDEIQSGPKPGDIVSGIRKKLKGFDRPFLFVLNPPLTGKNISGYDHEIDGYIERPYSLNSILHTVFILLQKKLPEELLAASTAQAKPTQKSLFYDPELMSFVSQEGEEEVLSPEPSEGPEPQEKQRDKKEWVDDLKPLESSDHVDSLSIIEDDLEETQDMVQSPETVSETPKTSEPQLKGYKGTILIIDDEPFIIRILKTIVEAEGYQTIIADNGLEGLKKCKEVIPDLILVDLMMPELDGYEFIEIIRTEEGFEKVPIIILSARPLTQDQGQAFKLGANFYMQKPVDRANLLGVLQNLMTEP